MVHGLYHPFVVGRWVRWYQRPGASGRAYPIGGRGFSWPRGAAPRGPRRLRRGSPTFFEESRRKEHQGSALDPGFYGRSFPLAGFGVSCLWYGRGAISYGMLRPIWDAFFGGKYAGKHFLRKKVSKSGRVPGPRNSPTTGTMWHNHQNERVPTSGPLKKGVRGASPRDSLRPGFL